MTTKERCLDALSISYSYEFARKLEQEKTNPILGYRTAGSRAELKTGDAIFQEMKSIGIPIVKKDWFPVDSWEFERAVLKFRDENGEEQTCQMGAYQTQFVTDGWENYELVSVGKGTAKDYEGLDVRGKLVLAEINQREEWWINFPVYQAFLKGAAALIAVQAQGYGEVHDTALNAQDIAGPEYAPAFSMSRADAERLRKAMENGKTHPVWLNVKSVVQKDQKTCNITGMIPGTRTDQMILLSAHYDSYFDGFQDDNCAVSMILGIARAILKAGYQPFHTLVFCAMAAEEWGVVDSKYDWSTGAYNQVFRIHPEWQGKVVADFNFELPAHAHSSRDGIRSTYEYFDFLQKQVDNTIVPPEAYPDGMAFLCPIETWSDDFSIAISGIPSMVNDFSSGPFMETCYHSQYDNQDVYQEAVYRFHHECYLSLLLAFDQLRLPPLNFQTLFSALEGKLDAAYTGKAPEEFGILQKALDMGKAAAKELWGLIESWNDSCPINIQSPYDKELENVSKELLGIFRRCQDAFVRLDWEDTVIFPFEASQRNMGALKEALDALKRDDCVGCLEALYQVDNNCYAFEFDREVYYRFTDYILHQPPERLMWGAGRISHHENLFDIVKALKGKLAADTKDFQKEIHFLEEAYRRQCGYFQADLKEATDALGSVTAAITAVICHLKRIN